MCSPGIRQRWETFRGYGFAHETVDGQWVMSEPGPVVWASGVGVVYANGDLVAVAALPNWYIRLVATAGDVGDGRVTS